MNRDPLLSLMLSIDYPGKPSLLNGIEMEIRPGEIFGLVGESGSGKSTIGLSLLRLLDGRAAERGWIHFEGRDLMGCGERELRQLRGRRIALVPQSPMSALNPALRIGAHFREAWLAHSRVRWPQARILDLLRRMGLPGEETFLRRYPHQVSVGQAQRVLITMAVMHRPQLLIADEPTSALDPASRQGILDLFRDLNREYAMAVLYISHDLASVAALCHRAALLSGGRLQEVNPEEFTTPEQIAFAPACG
jgi:ABC-type glutathione transport system ATPase component